jgi:hypothetical protein
VALIGYLLEDGTGAVVEEVDIDTAGIACTTALTASALAYDTYALTVDGRAASPATAVWGAVCEGLVVDGLTDNAFTCQIPMITP